MAKFLRSAKFISSGSLAMPGQEQNKGQKGSKEAMANAGSVPLRCPGKLNN